MIYVMYWLCVFLYIETVEDDYDMDFEMNYFHKLLKLKRKIIPQHRNHVY